jgi:tRNA (guanosine-2'-O-)-methyltransferase
LLVSLPDFSRTSGHYQQHRHAFSSEEFLNPSFLDWVGTSPVALVFGNELHGVDNEWNAFADGYAYIKMNGFAESLNVSVCAAILLHQLRTALPRQALTDWEQKLLVDYWVSRALDNSLNLMEKQSPQDLSYFQYVRSGKFFKPYEDTLKVE